MESSKTVLLAIHMQSVSLQYLQAFSIQLQQH